MRVLAVLALCTALPLSAAAQKGKGGEKPKSSAAGSGGPDLPSKLGLSKPVATVNGTAIPLSLYVDRLSLRYGPEVREQLIQEALLRQEAKRRNITATAADIDTLVKKAYDETVQKVGDEKKLAVQLDQTRHWTPAEFKAVMRSEAEVQVLRRKLAEALVKPEEIKDEEIDQRYQQRLQAFTLPDTLKMSHILIRRPTDGDPEKDKAARDKAAALLKRIQEAKGVNFEPLARQMSEDEVSKPVGGKIPSDIVRGQHPFGAAFEATVFNAPLGVVSEVISTPLGYHIIRVDAKKPGRTLPLSEVKEQVRTSLLTERREQKLDELFLQLRTRAQVQTGKF